ncbi:MAG: Zn-ribbon domain-containing OB-fold protein [Candidatus Micrarchaeia archaeon]
MIWRRIPERYNLIGSRCEKCGKEFFPSRKICPSCRRSGKITAKKMPRTGRVYSFTEVFSAPSGFEYETPYFLALVELDNGVRLLSQVVDSPREKVEMGAKVEACFRKINQDGEEGVIAYGLKFKVV